MVQAVLPLRGKILNVERKDEAAMYKNLEIQNLILGLGLGVKVDPPWHHKRRKKIYCLFSLYIITWSSSLFFSFRERILKKIPSVTTRSLF